MPSNVPQYVYKYRSLETSKDMEYAYDLIVNNKAKYSKPRVFNDPFECHIEIQVPQSAEERERLLEIVREEGSILRKICEENDFTYGTEVETKFLAGEYLDLIDEAVQQMINDGIRVFTVSSTYQNPAMWAYYADKQKGICVVMCNDVDYPNPYEVDYPLAPPSVVIGQESGIRNMEDIITSKSRTWKHENEWRYLAIPKQLADSNDLATLPKDMIVGVILGIRSEKWKREMIENWLELRSNQCTLWRAVKKKEEYLVEKYLVREYAKK